jgi:hypothetical protein
MFNPGFAPLSPQCWWAHKRGTDWHVVGVSQPAAALPVPSFGSDGSTFQGVETATGGDWWMFCRHSWGGKIIWIWICVQYIYISLYTVSSYLSTYLSIDLSSIYLYFTILYIYVFIYLFMYLFIIYLFIIYLFIYVYLFMFI